MNKEMKDLIKNHLACLDMYNEYNNGKNSVGTQNLISELMGIKMALSTMGIILEIDINPYYYEDEKPSTYSVRLEA